MNLAFVGHHHDKTELRTYIIEKKTPKLDVLIKKKEPFLISRDSGRFP
jgi:hypothetical protein